MPKEIPAEILTPLQCDRVEQRTWGDAREASEHYENCVTLLERQISMIGLMLADRWELMYAVKEQTDSNNETLITGE